MSKFSVLIADDHELILNGLKDFLSTVENIKSIDTARNLEEVKIKLNQNSFDIICLDIHFGKNDGRELAAYIRQVYPKVILLALTSFDDVETIQSTIHAGFNAFFLKSDDLSEIKNWLLAEDFEEVYLSSSTKDIYATKQLLKDNKFIHSIHLTEREKKILSYIMDELTTKQIAETMFLSQKTIEGYRANLMNKLNVTNIAGLVKKTILLGLLK